jgi:hypothetical protein
MAPYVDYLASTCHDGAIFGWVTFPGINRLVWMTKVSSSSLLSLSFGEAANGGWVHELEPWLICSTHFWCMLRLVLRFCSGGL